MPLSEPARMVTQSATFHRRGHHVQSSHGRRSALATGGDHLQGCMIALMPTEADAKRLALKGGEAAADLHCTLFFVGDDASAWSTEQRDELTANLRAFVADTGMGPIEGNVFGIAHWNGGGESPSWVWSIGDAKPEDGTEPVGTRLLEAQYLAGDALAYMHTDQPAVPVQHTPWVAHICAAYTGDLSLAKELEKRLGPVTFDRIRVSFGDDDTDIPLQSAAVTASGIPALRRDLSEAELAGCCDFVSHQKAWEKQLDKMAAGWQAVAQGQRRQIENQIKAAVEADDLERLAVMAVDQQEAEDFLLPHLTRMAEKGAAAQRKEAEAQGVDVPEVDLGLTAAGVGDFVRSLSRMTASIMSGSLVQAAQRFALSLFGSSTSGTAVADRVDKELADAPESSPVQQMGSALTAAQNEGRKAVLEAAPQADHYYASEILDKRTCGPCKKIDGHEFRTLQEASEAYPFGGYAQCKGLSRCRGTMFAVWDITETVVAAAAADTPEGEAMPWHAEKSSECGSDTPWAVIKDADGSVEGCHATEDEALQQVAALYAAEGEDSVEADSSETMAVSEEVPEMTGRTAPWEGVLVVEGITTGDGREFAADAITWGELPLPLRWNKEDSHGGEVRTVAVNVGRIDKVWRDEEKIMASGVLNLAEADGQRAYDLIKGEFLRGVSIDADSIAEADVEFVWPEGAGEGEDDDPLAMLFAQPEKVIYHGGRIRAATLCDIPAFAEAYVALLDEAGAVVAGGTAYPDLVQEQHSITQTQRARARRTLTASLAAVAEHPPAAWFRDPELSVLTGVTSTDEGRVYGHAAEHDSCHIGMDGVCTSPPVEDYHAYFMTGELVCEGGITVAVGQITVGMGHAPLSYGAPAATEHYDNTDCVVADVAVGNDVHGIWLAGALRPSATAAQVRALRAAGRVSGDWRRIGGKLRLVGLLTVNVPGFGFEAPKVRARAVTAAGGQVVQTALVAAGRLRLAQAPMISETELDQQAMHRVMEMLRKRRG